MDEPSPSRTEGYPALRRAGRGLALAAGAVALVGFNVDLLPMAGHTVIPVVALAALGTALGVVFRGQPFMASFWAWWLVFAASVLRRSSMASVPLASQLFGGALLGYPWWALWFAEGLRLAVYFWALFSGARFGSRLRGPRPRR